MKKLAGLLIVLAVLILVGYFGMGIITEKAIRKNIEVINQNKGVNAELGPYKRGLFSSNTSIKWQLHVPARIVRDAEDKPQVIPAQDFTTEMPLTVYHGPIIVADKKVLFGMGYATAVMPIPDKYAQQFDTLFTPNSTKPVLNISIFVNYLNKSTINLKVPSFSLTSKDGKMKMDWANMTSTTAMTSGVNQFSGQFAFEGVNYVKEGDTITLKGLKSDYDLRKHPTGIYLGYIKLSLPALTILANNTKQFELLDLKASSDSDIKDNLFSTHFSLAFQSAFADNKVFGPGNLDFSLRNLDAEVLGRLNKLTQDMQNSQGADQKRYLFTMIPEFPKLFIKGAEFEISEFKVKLPQGQVNGNMLVSIPKGELTNPFDLLQKIKGHAKLQVPKEIVKELMHQSLVRQLTTQPEMQQTLTQQLLSSIPTISQTTPTPEQLATLQTDKQLASLEQTGMVVVQGTDYSIEVALEQGKFTVNGKPYDPSFPIKF